MICRVVVLALSIVATKGSSASGAAASGPPNDSLTGLNASAKREAEDNANSSGQGGCFCPEGCFREKGVAFRLLCCRVRFAVMQTNVHIHNIYIIHARVDQNFVSSHSEFSAMPRY